MNPRIFVVISLIICLSGFAASASCKLAGNDPPCGEVTIGEVLNSITLWSQGGMDVTGVLHLINSWSDPLHYPPEFVPEPQDWILENGTRISTGVSPALYRLADGRLRMYITGMGGISSYISSDGLNFSSEKTDVLPEGINGEVFRLSDGRYRIIYNAVEGWHGPPEERRFYFISAVSVDGLNFVPEEGVRFRSQGAPDYDAISVPDIVNLSDGRLRMYYTGDMFAPAFGRNGNNVRSAVSFDEGLTWQREEGARLAFTSMDPEIVVTPEGKYRMYYTANPGDDVEAGQRIYSAFSDDGLDFTYETEVLSSGNPGIRYMDPVITEIPEGYRMYYSEATGEPGGEETKIKSAVWKIR